MKTKIYCWTLLDRDGKKYKISRIENVLQIKDLPREYIDDYNEYDPSKTPAYYSVPWYDDHMYLRLDSEELLFKHRQKKIKGGVVEYVFKARDVLSEDELNTMLMYLRDAAERLKEINKRRREETAGIGSEVAFEV